MRTSSLTLTSSRNNKAPGRLDVLQMLSGVLLIVFIWAHLFLVSSVLIDPAIMNAIAWFFEETYMAQIGGPAIGLLIFSHFLLAARKMPWRTEEQEGFLKHAVLLRHKDTWLWVAQVVSALVILVLAGIHMWVVLSDLPITAAKSAARIQSGTWLPFYLVLLPFAELHVGIGFYRIGVKFGYITRQNRRWFQRAEVVMTLGLVGIGLLTLVRFMFLSI